MSDFLLSTTDAAATYDENASRRAMTTQFGGSTARATFFQNQPPDIKIKIGKLSHQMGGGWTNALGKSSRGSIRTRNTVREAVNVTSDVQV
jgi:hypothetical protein